MSPRPPPPTALGTAASQRKVHVNSGLKVALTREEIVEVITRVAVSRWFASALNGIGVAREVFAERDGGWNHGLTHLHTDTRTL